MEQKVDRELQLGQYIPMHYHYQMLQDEARMLGFKGAIRSAVPLSGRVLELGGGTGVLSFFAAENASKVWCVEQQPALAAKAKELLALNTFNSKVEVIQSDAMSYLPPEPVDVVICEMLHSALLREKQIQVITSFKERYKSRFNEKLPRFIPEATVLGFDLICQDYNFFGYYAPLPNFQYPGECDRICQLSDPSVYGIVKYSSPIQQSFQCNMEIQIKKSGNLNGIRFITSNSLYILVKENRAINWMNQNLTIPLSSPLPVNSGDIVQVSFFYGAGDEIEALQDSIRINARKAG